MLAFKSNIATRARDPVATNSTSKQQKSGGKKHVRATPGAPLHTQMDDNADDMVGTSKTKSYIPPEGSVGDRIGFVLGRVEPPVTVAYALFASFVPLMIAMTCDYFPYEEGCTDIKAFQYLTHVAGGTMLSLGACMWYVYSKRKTERDAIFAISVVFAIGQLPYWVQGPSYSAMTNSGKVNMVVDASLLALRTAYIVASWFGW